MNGGASHFFKSTGCLCLSNCITVLLRASFYLSNCIRRSYRYHPLPALGICPPMITPVSSGWSTYVLQRGASRNVFLGLLRYIIFLFFFPLLIQGGGEVYCSNVLGTIELFFFRKMFLVGSRIFLDQHREGRGLPNSFGPTSRLLI